MTQHRLYPALRWLVPVVLLALLFLAWTGEAAVLLVLPAVAVLVGFGLNWKAVYGVLLFCIPLSYPLDLGAGPVRLGLTVPDEPLIWAFCLLLPLLLFSQGRRLRASLLVHPLSLVLLLQALWLVLATAFSTDPLLSLKYFLARGWMLAVFFLLPWLLLRGPRDLGRAAVLVTVPVIVSICIVLPRHAALDFSFLQVNTALRGLYENHVEYSTLLSMLLPVVAVAVPKRGRRLRAAWGALLLLVLAALLLAYARAAILAVVFAAVVGVALHYRRAPLLMPLFYAAMAGLALWLATGDRYLNFRPDFAQTYMHDDLNGHLTATFNGTDMSGMERVHRWVAAVRMSRERPLLGFGPNTFVHNYKPYTVTGFRTYVSRNEEGSTTHNYFLFLLAEQGWLAVILYGAVFWVAFRRAQRAYLRLTSRAYRRCVLGLSMVLAAAFVNNFFSELFDTHKIGALYYLALSGLVWLDSLPASGGAPTPDTPLL